LDANCPIIGGGDGVEYPVYYPTTAITINGGSVASVYAGNLGAGSVGSATIIINDGKFLETNAVSCAGLSDFRGISYNNSVGNSDIIINGADSVFENVYGGAMKGIGTVGKARITINSGSVSKLTAGGIGGDVLSSTIVINGGNVESLVGIDDGTVGDIKVIVKGGKILDMTVGATSATKEGSYDYAKLIFRDGEVVTLNAGYSDGILAADKISGEYYTGIIGNEEVAEAIGLKLIKTIDEISDHIEEVAEKVEEVEDKLPASVDFDGKEGKIELENADGETVAAGTFDPIMQWESMGNEEDSTDIIDGVME